MSDFAIQTRKLTRYFGSNKAVDSLDLDVPRGCVFGLLGRNGSGKTTTIRMLLGLLDPTRGSATVLGHDSRNLPPELRARIGHLAEGHHVYGWMTVKECARFQSSFYSTWKSALFDAVIDYFRLKPNARVKNLSRGERAGLCLALTLAPEPELLILDDPALGLDPVARRSLLELMVYATRSEKRTILFSSHLLSDVERVADRIAVLESGHLQACCSMETFRDRIRRVVLRFRGQVPALPKIPGLLQSLRTENEISAVIANFDGQTEELLKSCGADQIEFVPLNLEDAFISYLGDHGEKSFFLRETEGQT